jgi:beta-hydroxylase
LAPRYHIPRHRGVTKSLLRAHLGLVLPADRNKCRMRVADQIVHWEPGRCVVFDDFFHHEVWNDTDEERVVLIFDFVRPMRPLGRLLNCVLMWGIKKSAYFKEGRRNELNWEERLESALQAADKMLDEAPSRG